MNTVSAQIAAFLTNIKATPLPSDVRKTCRRLLEDVIGLAFAARHRDYVAATLASATPGPCTAIGHGHAGHVSVYDAALINGTAAHGEDYDDTFEGGPVHSGAVIVPAVLAVAQARGLDGAQVIRGIAAGAEVMCRMSLVSPQAIHRAGFHPTAVIGAPAAAAGTAAALGLPADRIMHAIGIACSLSSGIIEYLSDGSSTKRLHAGAAAQSGIRAAWLAEGGFTGPATALEGTHGFYGAFAPSVEPDYAPLLDSLGSAWLMPGIAFKPYACGTMTQPFIDCAIEAAETLAGRDMAPERIASIVCRVAEGTVHRLWEPLGRKHAPPNGYAGKFSTPYCIAVALLDGRAGLEQFTDERAMDPQVRALASRVSYVVDPRDPYPKRFTGHLRIQLDDESVIEIERPHLRGGVDAPLGDAEMAAKFAANIAFGGGTDVVRARLQAATETIVAGSAVDWEGLQ